LLEKTFSEKTVNGRSMVVKRLTTDQNLNQCHLLFVSMSERRRERELLERFTSCPVLTVGEWDEFLDHGGAVQMLMMNQSVRFSVNLQSAKTTRLGIHANALRVAMSVRGRYD